MIKLVEGQSLKRLLLLILARHVKVTHQVSLKGEPLLDVHLGFCLTDQLELIVPSIIYDFVVFEDMANVYTAHDVFRF